MISAGSVVAGAGDGVRLGAAVPKALVGLAGRPLVVHAVDALLAGAGITAVVVAVPGAAVERVRQLLAAHIPPGVSWEVVAGGSDRQESVHRALDVLPQDCGLVAIHDAARPFVTRRVVAECLRVAGERGAAVAGLPATDTVKQVAGDASVVRTLDRSAIWLAQTPQVFRTSLIRDAHRRALADGVTATDDAALIEHYGGTVWMVRGDTTNIKITTPSDLAWAEWALQSGAVAR
jgi:2-C-methyl-D-erythritol 4-phosphate cytidylyltransferase